MIISASRRTDIPAFYSPWFMERLRSKEVLVPHMRANNRYYRVDLSPELIDGIVFWTKNPKPMFPYLTELENLGHPFYFQFTLTPYPKEIEKKLPEKKILLETFAELSERIGKEKVIWRYDPIFLTPQFSMEKHIDSFGRMTEFLKNYTEKVIFSFLDLYPSTKRKMTGNSYGVLSKSQQNGFVCQMAEIADDSCLGLSACSEEGDFSGYGVKKASCIDLDLLSRISLIPLIGKKDKNQRKVCGCAESIDIGCYDTCGHGCYYCYANNSSEKALKNCMNHNCLSSALGREVLGNEQIQPLKKQKKHKNDMMSLFD